MAEGRAGSAGPTLRLCGLPRPRLSPRHRELRPASLPWSCSPQVGSASLPHESPAHSCAYRPGSRPTGRARPGGCFSKEVPHTLAGPQQGFRAAPARLPGSCSGPACAAISCPGPGGSLLLLPVCKWPAPRTFHLLEAALAAASLARAQCTPAERPVPAQSVHLLLPQPRPGFRVHLKP